MRAMVLEGQGRRLRLRDMPRPVPAPGRVLIEVGACAVCRADLHILDGELLPSCPWCSDIRMPTDSKTDLAPGDRDAPASLASRLPDAFTIQCGRIKPFRAVPGEGETRWKLSRRFA